MEIRIKGDASQLLRWSVNHLSHCFNLLPSLYQGADVVYKDIIEPLETVSVTLLQVWGMEARVWHA